MKASPFDPPYPRPAVAPKCSPLDPPRPGVVQNEAAPTQLQLLNLDINLPWSKAFLRVGEVANFLDVSEDQVLRMIDAGDLEAISIAANVASADRHHRRISGRSLHALVNRRRKLPQ